MTFFFQNESLITSTRREEKKTSMCQVIFQLANPDKISLMHLDNLSQNHTKTQLQRVSLSLQQVVSFMGSSKTSFHRRLRTDDVNSNFPTAFTFNFDPILTLSRGKSGFGPCPT